MTGGQQLFSPVHQAEIDARFFVERLTAAAQTIKEPVKRSLMTTVSRDRQFAKELDAWAKKQGIANFGDEAFYDITARQIVYRMLGKILFYQSLRSHRPDLPIIDFSGLDVSQVASRLKEHFEKARRIDYQAVFETDICDQVPLPEPALQELRRLGNDLNNYNFSIMPQDIVGQVFERLIPPEERHSLGQYFTPEALVDFIIAFCVRSKSDYVLDPTCGSGTFLLRAYDRLNFFGERDHTRLLDQLWGVDIAHFPAELATINLYRQNLADYANFPRIVRKDFFEIQPGDFFEFPPSVASQTNNMVSKQIPVFDAAVGNFPYIRKELIEKSVQDYRQVLNRALVEGWLKVYPELFRSGGIPRLAGQADIYAYLFFHAAQFIKSGGRMGFVTSNSWIDASYGYELQKFFLRNFKIVAILESRCEPWFEQSAVNTVVTILERCADREEKEQHTVKFVKVKKKLRDLIPWDMKLDAMNRWHGVDALVRKIESVGSEYLQIVDGKTINTLKSHQTYEDEDFRIRMVTQGELLAEVEKAGTTVKWGQYLRAPEVYFEIRRRCQGRLIPLTRLAEVCQGTVTGADEFFYVDRMRIPATQIPLRFFRNALRSSKELKRLEVDVTQTRSMALIISEDDYSIINGRFRFVNRHLEKYVASGKEKYERHSIFHPWFCLKPRGQTPALVFNRAISNRFSAFVVRGDCVLAHFVVINPYKDINFDLLAAVLNSSIVSLFVEVHGRSNLGEGSLKFEAKDAKGMSIPNIYSFPVSLQHDILSVFGSISRREALPLHKELSRADRRRLDALVLEAIGLEPAKYLQPLYEGLTQLVQERLDLGTMRSTVRRSKGERDLEKIKRQVTEEVLPQGPKIFPKEFLDAATARGDFVELDIPSAPIKLEPEFFGKQKVTSAGGWSYEARSPAEAKFIVYAQGRGHSSVKIPKEPIAVFKTVKNYEIYLRELRDTLYKAFAIRIFDHKQAQTLAEAVLEDLGLPKVEA